MDWYKLAQQMTLENAWSLLALPKNKINTPDALDLAKRQYRKLIRRYHPDIYKGEADAQELSRKFNAAWKVIEEYFANPHLHPQPATVRTKPQDAWIDPSGWRDFRDFFRGRDPQEAQRNRARARAQEEAQEKAEHSYFTEQKYQDYINYIFGSKKEPPFARIYADGERVRYEPLKGFVFESNTLNHLEQRGFSWEHFFNLLINRMQEVADVSSGVFELSEVFEFVRAVNLAKSQGFSLKEIIEHAKQELQNTYQSSLKRRRKKRK